LNRNLTHFNLINLKPNSVIKIKKKKTLYTRVKKREMSGKHKQEQLIRGKKKKRSYLCCCLANEELICDFACGWVRANIADRHGIRTNGGYWIHQIPSKPGRGIFHLPNILLRFCHVLNTNLSFSDTNTHMLS
jgi:hypothetical protein